MRLRAIESTPSDSDPRQGLVWSVFANSFPRLRNIAARLLSSERIGHTLQPTALVNEAFLKLQSFALTANVRKEDIFYWSAYVMRQVLIDSGRVRGKWAVATVHSLPEDLCILKRPNLHPDLALALKLKLEALEKLDSKAAQALWLRYVEEKTIPETASALHRTQSQVRNDCDFAIKWMSDQFDA